MCKLFMLAGIKKKHVSKAWKLVHAATPLMSVQDKDGVGYVASAEGTLFGERWTINSDAFKRRNMFSSVALEMKELFKDAIDLDETYNSFGDISLFEHTTSIMLHTRMATCAKGITNTHPFVQGNTALIHNGVISNAYSLSNITSECDSETILNEYIRCDVAGDLSRLQEVADNLQGYYACGILGRQGALQYMDIFRDETATLVVGWIEELDTYAYCTTAAILKRACKAASLTVSHITELNSGFAIRLDVKTGLPIQIVEFLAEAQARLESENYLKIG